MGKKKEKKIQHYSSSQKILLVGEGNFSFSACLAKAFGSARNMVATCLHSKDALRRKHQSSGPHLAELNRRGCLVLYEINVYDMNQNPSLMSKKFDVIIFNFPHAGHCGLNETDYLLIEMHRNLLQAFFNSARHMLTRGGEVHVAHRDDCPYNRWKIEELAERADLYLKEKVDFNAVDYPGYINKRGGAVRCDGKFPLKSCFTFKFCLKENTSQMPDNLLEKKFKGMTLGNVVISGL
ncbi:uncharacterized protein At4g26485-like [Quercus lobata]|uniref:25S rRNA (uridine-N(3))-methyltransferase BMT5-like domain-containing protein n=1 Tax=Quercus lobata TaxID=97700 RepID=A0A7N2LIB1_QUELO|nr:uncharacterized protein At4g26485-like [Quercus lobata]